MDYGALFQNIAQTCGLLIFLILLDQWIDLLPDYPFWIFWVFVGVGILAQGLAAGFNAV